MSENLSGSGAPAAATDLLRVVAIVLIVNSHLDGFYPVPTLATGGAIGNALFFALSGFGLAASARGVQSGFAAWYRRRICRIYPALLPAVALFMALPGRAFAHWGPGTWVAQLIWPTAYWFIGALMLFYMLFYPLRRVDWPAAYLGALAVLFVPYLVWYCTDVDLSRYTIEGEGHFKWIHYCQVMLFGAYLARRKDLLTAGAGRRDGVLLAALVAAYYGVLLLVAHQGAGALQIISHLLVYPMIFLSLRLAGSAAARRLLALPGITVVVAFVAAITLELYLVQGAVRSLPWVQAPKFPLNIMACWALTLAAAYLLHRVALVLARAAGCSR